MFFLLFMNNLRKQFEHCLTYLFNLVHLKKIATPKHVLGFVIKTAIVFAREHQTQPGLNVKTQVRTKHTPEDHLRCLRYKSYNCIAYSDPRKTYQKCTLPYIL